MDAWGWVGWGRKGVVPRRQEEMFGGDGYVRYLDCGGGFHRYRVYLKVSDCRL